MKTKALYWFRNDLRLHDPVGLVQALSQADELLPVYIFDPRLFETTFLGIPKTGKYRAKFLLEAVQDLRASLQALGSNLLILQGKPEEHIPHLVKNHNISQVWASKEATQEEIFVETQLRNLLPDSVSLQLVWQHSLYYPEDLPYTFDGIPEIFTQFRKDLEQHCAVRPSLPPLSSIPTLALSEWGEMPTMADFGLEKPLTDTRAVLNFKGGESAGLQRLNEYFWEKDLLKTYKETRNGLLGADYSNKFSPWLALGCFSPRTIYEQVKRYETERLSNSSTYWLIFELIWRDYFRFIAFKHGPRIFYKTGIKGRQIPLKNDYATFLQWAEGRTGIPFIDANMRELNTTGFMSNRGRQNVASYLVKDMKINWIWGAMYFESLLIDYDPTSNWGNWNYAAGVGNDPREDRYFNIGSQAARYDPEGAYVQHWLQK